MIVFSKILSLDNNKEFLSRWFQADFQWCSCEAQSDVGVNWEETVNKTLFNITMWSYDGAKNLKYKNMLLRPLLRISTWK